MKKPQFITAKQAAHMIADNSTLCCVGMTLVGACESVLKAIEQKFFESGSPNNLTLLHAAGHSDREGGLQHLAHEGLLKRVIGGHWGLCPGLMEMIQSNQIEAYNLPQGQIANMFHSMALREPGKLSKIGLGTFIDPRIEGGKMNARTKALGDIISVVTLGGEEYLCYHEVPIDTLLIRGTYSDDDGNISTEHEAVILERLPAVMATKRFGGKVIVQVKQRVLKGSIDPKKVEIPGVLVDAVVVCEEPETDHRQTSSWFFDASYSGQIRAHVDDQRIMELSVRKVIGRRAAMFMERDVVINTGTGIPNDVMGAILSEEGVVDDVMITVESGVYGGTPAEGIDFGVSRNPLALVSHDIQFAYYIGAGIDYTFMGAGEMDRFGNVNATCFGRKSPGAGGFIDITTGAKNVIFCATFTGVGLKVNYTEAGIQIVQEGSVKKLVSDVQQISYSGERAIQSGQTMYFVTERAVFKLEKDGPVLIEIAEGIDIERDIFAQMEFKPVIARDLKTIPVSIYSKGPFGLKKLMESYKSRGTV